MDVLLRIVLVDGTKQRTVLRPTESRFQLPPGTEKSSQADYSLWIYASLLGAALLLSLTPSAQKTRVAYCALALVAGSLASHALGGFIPPPNRGMTENEAKRILNGLMLNTYRAFILDSDEEVYDVLARSVEGDALKRIYLENRGRLTFKDEESAASLVDRLDIKTIGSIKTHANGSVTILADLDAYGSVFHWEHVHFRCNAFTAEVTLVPADGY